MYLYVIQWTPQVVTDTFLLPIVFYILTHMLLIKRYQKNTTHNFNVYCGSMLPFIILLPFYMMIGALLTNRGYPANDWYVVALWVGTQYAIITWFIADTVSNYLLNLRIDDQSSQHNTA